MLGESRRIFWFTNYVIFFKDTITLLYILQNIFFFPVFFHTIIAYITLLKFYIPNSHVELVGKEKYSQILVPNSRISHITNTLLYIKNCIIDNFRGDECKLFCNIIWTKIDKPAE